MSDEMDRSDPQLIELGPNQFWSLQHWCKKHDCPLENQGTIRVNLDELGRQYIDSDERGCPKFAEESIQFQFCQAEYLTPEEAQAWYDANDCAGLDCWSIKPCVVDLDEERAVQNLIMQEDSLVQGES